jgi:hypothetical protein
VNIHLKGFIKRLRIKWFELKREIKFLTFLWVSFGLALFLFLIIQLLGNVIGYKVNDLLKDFWFPAFASFFGSIKAFAFSFYNQAKTEFQHKLLKLKELQFILKLIRFRRQTF